MANQEHVEVLKKHSAAWNLWRTQNPDLTPDLIKADLRDEDLHDANLAGVVLDLANLERANLSGTNLSAAHMVSAKLSDANLSRANLTNATLAIADLTRANLEGAVLKDAIVSDANLKDCNLTAANLEGAYFSNSILEGANFTGANLERTNFREAKLAGAKFLNAKLRDVNFQMADLSSVDLSREFSHVYIGGKTDFGGATLRGAQLWEADLRWKNFSRADLREAFLGGAQLREAIFNGADLRAANIDKAHLQQTDFSDADLRGANLSGSYLSGADLRRAQLEGANLEGALLIEAKVDDANLSQTRVYGISVWNIDGVPKNQSGLIITPETEASITVDDLEVAQFIYLLLKREKLRNVIDTITSKAVLILGRFTPERKPILEGIASELRANNLLPIIFDFERSTSRDFTETIKTLASLSVFVIADITNPKSAPLELQATVPDYQIPFVPLIQKGEAPFSMFSDLLNKYDWVLDPVEYSSLDQLKSAFKAAVIDRAWEKRQELHRAKAKTIQVLSLDKFLESK